MIHKVDSDNENVFIRLAATGEVLAQLPYRRGLGIMVTHGNMLHQDKRRADDYIAGVLDGLTASIISKLAGNDNGPTRAAAAG